MDHRRITLPFIVAALAFAGCGGGTSESEGANDGGRLEHLDGVVTKAGDGVTVTPKDGEARTFELGPAVEKAGLKSLREGQVVSYDLVTERGKTAAGNLRAQ